MNLEIVYLDSQASAFRKVDRFLIDLVSYATASGLALACDYGLLVGLSAAGLNYLVASAVSFTAGMGVAYALSARFVFSDRRRRSSSGEAGGFVLVGLLGLALTQVLLYILVSRLGLSPAFAKVPTAAVVFAFNFLCRRTFVFVEAAE